MKVPKKIRICGQDFKVIQEKDLQRNDEKLLGLCIVDECTIYLKKNLSREKKAEVFFHECIHAIDENLCLKIGESRVNHLCLHILGLIVNNGLDFRT